MAMVATARTGSATVGWLRGARFDLTFIVGIVLLGIGSGWVVTVHPSAFGLVLALDVWFLGYHHVIATYTRLCFDAESFRANRFHLFVLPPLVLGSVVTLVLTVGPWAVASIYLYWQWWHYTRQSYGVGRVYAKKSPVPVVDEPRLTLAIVYLVPLWGIIHRSNQRPDSLLGLELKVITVPSIVEMAVAVAALVSVAWWAGTRVAAWRRGRLARAHTLYVVSHLIVFFVGYIAIGGINEGWLVLNVWHNAQYVLFVWLFNTNRFKGGVQQGARFLSTISQPRNVAAYFVVLFLISTTVYLVADVSVAALETSALPVAIIFYQAVNFHHYIVDSRIWKVRRKPMQRTLGIDVGPEGAA